MAGGEAALCDGNHNKSVKIALWKKCSCRNILYITVCTSRSH